MNLNSILDEQSKKLEIDEKTFVYLKEETEYVVEKLRKAINKLKVDAEPFLGGSFVKGTLYKSDEFDIDIFVRFSLVYENLSVILEGIIEEIVKDKKFKFTRAHGSRDYFKVWKKKEIIFEIIPISRIKKPEQARNITDLSYFHVNYVVNKLRHNGLKGEIILAKQFCKANGIYGAESYIHGFSGYGLECLIIHYGSFVKMLQELIKIKDRIILDPEKQYKRKEDVLFEMNESKLQSPIILVDPTWKERNVLAGLSFETFKKFQKLAETFLKKPSAEFFAIKKLNLDKLKELDGEFIHLNLKTNRQEGDIAGTKMKKFSQFIHRELSKYFAVIAEEFNYLGGQEADFYLVLKSKEEVLINGPPLKIKQAVSEFKKIHKNVFVKGDYLYSHMKIDFSGKSFLKKWIRDNLSKVKEMGIVGIEIE